MKNRIFIVLVLAPLSALALINPKYTVVDLMSDCGQVYLMRVTAPEGGKIAAEIVETLAGEAPAEKRLTFDYHDANDLPEEKVTGAFDGAKTALAVLCIQKKNQDGARVGAVEIGMTWMGLTQGDDKNVWKLDKDPNDLETVWAGSARRLVAAIRYTLSDPGASFPVAANLTWGADLALGQLADKAHGCLVTGDGVVVLSTGGDRVIQPGQPPTDITNKLGLTSRSRALVAGDFNADGRMDLASWDGAKLWLWLRGEDGKFVKPTGGFALAECLSLGVREGEFVVGTSQGVTLMKFDGTSRRLAGGGGPCVVTALDILQVAADTVTRYSGESPPVVTKLPVLKRPTTVVAGDFDTDGQLDLMVAGEGGATLLARDESGQWAGLMSETGELGVAASDAVVALGASDLNGDGRQAVAMFHATGGPGLFFNRGFACFGVARTLTFTESELPAVKALSAGQQAGIVCDLNGDGAPDLLAVDLQQKVWAIFTVPAQPRRFQLTVESTTPVALTVALGQRVIGIWVVRPGEPSVIGLPKAGKVTVRWKTADGQDATKDIVVTAPVKVRLP